MTKYAHWWSWSRDLHVCIWGCQFLGCAAAIYLGLADFCLDFCFAFSLDMVRIPIGHALQKGPQNTALTRNEEIWVVGYVIIAGDCMVKLPSLTN